MDVNVTDQKSENKKSSSMSIVAILFFLVLGAASFYGFYKIRKDNRIVETWPKTSGKILKTDVIAGRSPKLRVTYEFFVNGNRYESGNVYRGILDYELGSPYNLDELEFLKTPEVKYNPDNPSDCCLLLWFDKLWFKILIFTAGVVLSLIGLFGLLGRLLK